MAALDYIRPHQSLAPTATALMIVNSDLSMSSQCADYYQSARGLANHRLGFTTVQLNDMAYNGQSAIVKNYIDQHNINIVITTPGCPQHTSGSYVLESTLASPDANGSSFNIHPFITTSSGNLYVGPNGYSVQLDTGNTYRPPNGNGYFVAQSGDLDYLINRRPVPGFYIYNLPAMPPVAWGRLGFPAYSGMPAETFAETKRMIDDCIYAEQQAKNTKSFALGFGDYTAQGVHPLQWYAWQFAQAAGLQTNYWTCDAAGTGARGLPVTTRNNLNTWLGKQPDYISANVYNGTEHIAADCYLGSAVINDGIAGNGTTAYKNYWTSLAPKRGAWGFNWCSSGNQFIGNLLLRGGAAGIGPTKEPYTQGLPEDASVMALALQGFSLAEINWLMQPTSNYAMTAWGDPLYRPFPAQGLNDGQLLSITDNTPARWGQLTSIDRAMAMLDKQRTLSNITPIRGATWHD